MNWYEKLNRYFPNEEMKSKEQLESLLEEKADLYHKDESPLHIMMCAEFDDFIFVDYLLVSSKARGQGLGHQLIEKLKKRNKAIILEVEPIHYSDTDTEKRLRFYKREGFKHAKSIGYECRTRDSGDLNQLEILYWAPNNESEKEIFEKMLQTYQDIHTFRHREFYGKKPVPVSKVLTYDEERDVGNMLKGIE